MSRLCQLGLAGLPRDCFHTCRTSTESVSSHLISSTSVCSDLSWNHSLSLCAAYLILCFVLFCLSDCSSIVLLIENQHIIPDHTDVPFDIMIMLFSFLAVVCAFQLRVWRASFAIGSLLIELLLGVADPSFAPVALIFFLCQQGTCRW